MKIDEEVYIESGFKDKLESGSKGWLVNKKALKISLFDTINLAMSKKAKAVFDDLEKLSDDDKLDWTSDLEGLKKKHCP